MALAGLLAVVVLFLPIDWSGLWVPYELETAELARRMPQEAAGAAHLVLGAGADPAAQLGGGRLPLASVAVGLEAFGLHDWAGRLPLALWAGIGLLPLYLVAARFVDRVAAAYAVMVLVTTPLFFLQARTILGGGVIFSGLSCSVAGLAVLALDERTKSPESYFGWGLLAGLGLLTGFEAGGIGFGVACPTLAVGLSWLISRLVVPKAWRWSASDGVALASLATGMSALALWSYLIFWRTVPDYQALSGSRLAQSSKVPTFDSVLHQLGFGLFPWSALLPMVLGSALLFPSSARAACEHRLSLCVAILMTVALAIHGSCAPLTGAVPFVGVAAVALIIGIGIRSVELLSRHAGATSALRLLALGSGSLLVILGLDLCKQPAQIFNAFALPAQSFPASFEAASRRWWTVAVGALVTVLAVALVRRHARREEAGAPSSSNPEAWPNIVRSVGWTNRVRVAALAVAAFGAALSLSYFPALASRLAPREVFSAYERLSRPDEPLAALGAAAAVVDYYARGAAVRASSVTDALAWLNKASPRSWLVFDERDLAALNALHREASSPPRNLSIAAIGSSNLMLATNQLPVGEQDRNPLGHWIRSAADGSDQVPMHPLDVDLGGQLRCLGWSIMSLDGRPAARLRAGTGYRIAVSYEVLAPMSSTWKALVQMEGEGRRLEADHELLDGRYPTRFWRPGDVITDEHTFGLAADVPDGVYQVFLGLYDFSNRLLSVHRGKHEQNRIAAGALSVAGSDAEHATSDLR